MSQALQFLSNPLPLDMLRECTIAFWGRAWHIIIDNAAKQIGDPRSKIPEGRTLRYDNASLKKWNVFDICMSFGQGRRDDPDLESAAVYCRGTVVLFSLHRSSPCEKSTDVFVILEPPSNVSQASLTTEECRARASEDLLTQGGYSALTWFCGRVDAVTKREAVLGSEMTSLRKSSSSRIGPFSLSTRRSIAPTRELGRCFTERRLTSVSRADTGHFG